MGNIYTAEFLEQYEVLEEMWGTDRYADAKQLRDRRARELRKQGWAVKSVTFDYTDLGRFTLYKLEARRRRGE